MKEESRKRLSELILEELSEKIKGNESLKKKLEPFADLPVERVADAILKQFHYLLSSDLRDLIITLIEQEVAANQARPSAPTPTPEVPISTVSTEIPQEVSEPHTAVPAGASHVPGSIMEHFGSKGPFPTERMDIELHPDDWLYLYGFGYAPVSTGKGIPTQKLKLQGVDRTNPIFLLDYGDVRFYMNKLTTADYMLDRMQKPTLTSQKIAAYRYEHEKILNTLRSEDVIAPLPFWTVVQSREQVISRIEDQYVELLRALIDIHDSVDWDVEVYAFDQHLIQMPAIASAVKNRPLQRLAKHQVSRGKDIKLLERLMMKEKTLAQDIHSQLLLHATKGKIDFMIRVDNAFMEDWKSILAVRYAVGKDKRKVFCQNIRDLQNEYEEYELMIRVTSPSVRFTFRA